MPATCTVERLRYSSATTEPLAETIVKQSPWYTCCTVEEDGRVPSPHSGSVRGSKMVKKHPVGAVNSDEIAHAKSTTPQSTALQPM